MRGPASRWPTWPRSPPPRGGWCRRVRARWSSGSAGRWQVLAQCGPADITGYHEQHLASLELVKCGVIRTGRHLVAGLDSRSRRRLSGAGRGARSRGARPGAGAAAARCSSARRRSSTPPRRCSAAIGRFAGWSCSVPRPTAASSGPVRDVEQIVASLWPVATVRYVSRDAAMALERPLRRLVGEACSTGRAGGRGALRATRRCCPPTGSTASPCRSRRAARSCWSRLPPARRWTMRAWRPPWSSPGSGRWSSGRRRSRPISAASANEDRETGCMTGASLPRRLDGCAAVGRAAAVRRRC